MDTPSNWLKMILIKGTPAKDLQFKYMHILSTTTKSYSYFNNCYTRYKRVSVLVTEEFIM